MYDVYICLWALISLSIGSFYVKNKVDLTISEHLCQTCLQHSIEAFGDDGKPTLHVIANLYEWGLKRKYNYLHGFVVLMIDIMVCYWRICDHHWKLYIDVLSLKCLYNLGTVYYSHERYEEAERYYLQCLQRTKVRMVWYGMRRYGAVCMLKTYTWLNILLHIISWCHTCCIGDIRQPPWWHVDKHE